MPILRPILLGCLSLLLPLAAHAQTETPPKLAIELNTVEDTGGACRLTFVAQTSAGLAIDQVVFETVVFDQSGGVASLSLFDFRGLPADRQRVRQFDLPGMACASIGRVLINGTNSCVIGGTESDVCDAALSLGSRIDVELLG